MKGLLAIVLLCGFAIAAALIMTGPQGARRKAALRPSAGVEGARPPHGGENPLWEDVVTGEAAGIVERDRSRLVIRLETAGSTAGEASQRLVAKRRELLQALAAAGHSNVDATESDLGASTTRQGAGRASVVLRIAFEEGVDFTRLMASPKFDGLGTITDMEYWMSDPQAALAGLRAAAVDRARSRAASLYHGLDWREDRIKFRDAEQMLTRPSKFRAAHMHVMAKIHVTGNGRR